MLTFFQDNSMHYTMLSSAKEFKHFKKQFFSKNLGSTIAHKMFC